MNDTIQSIVAIEIVLILLVMFIALTYILIREIKKGGRT